MKKQAELKTLPEFKLKEKVSIYVPSTYAVNVKILNDKYVQKVEMELASIFGGATSMETTGSYVANNGTLVREKINLVYAFAEKIGNEEIDKILTICEWLKLEMVQECIALEINGEMHFI